MICSIVQVHTQYVQCNTRNSIVHVHLSYHTFSSIVHSFCIPEQNLHHEYIQAAKKSLPNLRNNTIYRINPVLCSLQQTGMPPLTSAIANSHIVYVFFGNLENIFEKTSVAPTHTSSHTAPWLKLLLFGPTLPLFLHTQTRIAPYNTDPIYAWSQSAVHVSIQYTEQDPRKNQSYVITTYRWVTSTQWRRLYTTSKQLLINTTHVLVHSQASLTHCRSNTNSCTRQITLSKLYNRVLYTLVRSEAATILSLLHEFKPYYALI